MRWRRVTIIRNGLPISLRDRLKMFKCEGKLFVSVVGFLLVNKHGSRKETKQAMAKEFQKKGPKKVCLLSMS